MTSPFWTLKLLENPADDSLYYPKNYGYDEEYYHKCPEDHKVEEGDNAYPIEHEEDTEENRLNEQSEQQAHSDAHVSVFIFVKHRRDIDEKHANRVK